MESDKTTSWDDEVHSDSTLTVVDHVHHFALAVCKKLRNGTEMLFVDVDCESLHRLVQLAIDHLGDNLWLANGHFKSFAAHGLNQHCELKFTTSLEYPRVRAIRRQDIDRNVTDQFALKAVLDHSSGQLLAIETGQRRRVNPNSCRQTRLIDPNSRKRSSIILISNGFANGDLGHPSNSDDFASACFGRCDSFKTLCDV